MRTKLSHIADKQPIYQMMGTVAKVHLNLSLLTGHNKSSLHGYFNQFQENKVNIGWHF